MRHVFVATMTAVLALTCAVLTGATLTSAARADSLATGHDAPQPPATLAEWAQGAQLFEGLGSFHRKVTTSSPLAQEYFDQGMRLLWAFNHDEAVRSFAKAAEIDPACAACYWGVALTVGPNYNMGEIDEVRSRVARAALQQAQANAAHASPVEQALISALTARYPAEPVGHSDRERVLTDYAESMRAVAARFPEDLDVQTLCAEAEMTVNAWKLWSKDGRPLGATPEIEARLESVLRRDPNHPGANHYYIHVMEASPHPEAALAAAERLRGLMPGAGHIDHMPAHILERVGRYEDAAEADRRAVAADQAYLAATHAPDYYPMYLVHNYEFLAYSAAMEGRKAETLATVQSVVQAVPLQMVLAMGASGWNLTQQYAALVRFGLWDEMIALAAPDARARGLTAGYLYGRGVALAARGRTKDAEAVLAQLRELGAAAAEEGAGNSRLRDVLGIAVPVVAARIAASGGRADEAVTLLQQAVTAEDALDYAEPPDWFFPARHLLGAQLLIAGRAAEAERVYRDDLVRNPANGWALYGLAQALRAQGETSEAARVMREFETAWHHADVRLTASAFWFAGPDTTSCECQRTSADRQTGRELLGTQHEAGVH